MMSSFILFFFFCMATRNNRWLFTLFDPETKIPTWDPATMIYLVYQMERCPQTGRTHWQGYVHLKKRTRLLMTKTLLGSHEDMHLSSARGTEKQNRDYCTKLDSRVGDSVHEFGTYDPLSGQGKRTDLKKATEIVASGAPLQFLAQQIPETYVKYHAGLDRLYEMLRPRPPVVRPMHTIVLWGDTGLGKTYRIITKYHDPNIPILYVATLGRGPFDDYSGEPVLLIDEFIPYSKNTHEGWPIQLMNKILDPYTVRIDCRYRNHVMAWNIVFIISNLPPEVWYPDEPPSIRDTIMRRISDPAGHVIHVTARDQEIALPEIPPHWVPPPVAPPPPVDAPIVIPDEDEEDIPLDRHRDNGEGPSDLSRLQGCPTPTDDELYDLSRLLDNSPISTDSDDSDYNSGSSTPRVNWDLVPEREWNDLHYS